MFVLLSIALADEWGGKQGETAEESSLEAADGGASGSLQSAGTPKAQGLQTVGGGDAVRSPISQDVVQGLVKSVWPQLRACYDDAELTERMDVAFTLYVRPDGTVHDVRQDLTAYDLDFSLCVREQLESLRFPAFAGKDVVEVSSSVWFAGQE